MRRYGLVVLCLAATLLGGSVQCAERYKRVDGIDGFRLEIGSVLPPKFMKDVDSSGPVSVGAGWPLPGYNVSYKGFEYVIGVDKDTIVFIRTEERKFSTPEEIRIGMTLADVMRIAQGSLTVESGWACYVPLKSGWKAAFVPKESSTVSIFDKVAFLFMRRT